MAYRTKTYIAADWDGDKNAVEQLYKWKKSNYWSLDFHDAHDLTQARDSSLNCSIKSSLATRLDVSKTFVLIVGNTTVNIAVVIIVGHRVVLEVIVLIIVAISNMSVKKLSVMD